MLEPTLKSCKGINNGLQEWIYILIQDRNSAQA